MASMSSIVRIASAAVVGNDAPFFDGGHEGLELEVVTRLAAETLLAGAEGSRHLHPVPVLGGKGVEDGDRAVVAGDLRVEAQHRGGEHGATDVRAPTVGQREVRIHGAVDPGGGEFCFGADDPGAGDQQPQQADGIATHIHGGATGQGELIADVALLPEGGREGHVDLGDVAQFARADDLDQTLGERVVLVMEGLHDHDTWVAIVHLGHGAGFVGVGREGLLAQDVLAGVEGGDGPLSVEPVREWVVDGVDLGVLHQRRIAVQHAGNSLFTGEFGGTFGVACRHRGDLGPAGSPGRFDESRGGDVGRSQNADSQHAAVTGGVPARWTPGQ